VNLLRLPLPNPRQMGVLVLIALSVGVVTGRALHSATASGSPVVMAEAPPSKQPTTAPKASSATLAPPTGNVAPEPAAPPAPAPAPEPTPAPSEPAPEPSEPVDEAPANNEPTQPTDNQNDSQDDNTKPISGTVVLANPGAHGYVLATDAGDLIEVHAKKKLPDPRALLDADVVDLDNGTSREAKHTSEGSNETAKLRGTVTFVAADKLSYVVSARGASLLIHSAAGRPLPALLDLATVEVHFDDQDELVEDSLETTGKATGAIDLHGKVQGLDDQTKVLTLPADDLRALELDISVAIPADLDIDGLAADQVIAATATVGADGSYTLESWRRDDDARQANKPQ
jgi:hypothetical protein